MITSEILEAAGYRFYEDRSKGVYCDGLYQKVIRTEQGEKAYFINFSIWNFPRMSADIAANNSVSVDTRLYLSNDPIDSGGIQFNPIVHADWTVERVEALLARAYIALDCVPDVHNND
jgi:hypothetical protein